MSNSPAEGEESGAMLGYGSAIQVASADSPGEFVYMGEVSNITPPSATVDMVDVTHMQSPNRTREFVRGLIDAGESSWEMNFIPSSESDVFLINWLNTPVTESARRTVRNIYPNGAHWEFSAELQGYEISVPTDDKMTASVTLKVTGPFTPSYAL